LWPEITMECLMTEDGIKIPFARRASVRGQGVLGSSLSIGYMQAGTHPAAANQHKNFCVTYPGLSVQNCTRLVPASQEPASQETDRLPALNPSREKQDDENDKDDADDTDAAVTETVAVAAEAAAEASEEKNDEDDNEDGSERHDRISIGRMPVPGRGPT